MGHGRGGSWALLSALLNLPYRMAALVVLLVRPSKADQVLSRLQSVGPAIGALSWRDFEKLVDTGFQRRGFRALQRAGEAGVAGVDRVLARHSERFLVRCRHWRAQQVNLRTVRELHSEMMVQRMAGGFVVTSGTFTKKARRFAADKNIELIDGRHLDALLKDGRRRVAEIIFEGVAANGPETAPYCPACKTPMVVRTAKRGAGAGSLFWACAQFPTCRQTMVMWSEGRRSA